MMRSRSWKSSTGILTALLCDRPSWLQAESDLSRNGLFLPLPHRWAWAEDQPAGSAALLTATAPDGLLLGAGAVQYEPCRSLPGYRFMRVARFGHGLTPAACEAVLAGLKAAAETDPTVLELSIGVFSRGNLDPLAGVLAGAGFRRAAQPRSYTHTLTLSLAEDREALLAKLPSGTRYKLRKPANRGLCVRAVTGAAYAGEMERIYEQTMRRTGGFVKAMDAARALRLSRSHPELSRIAGLFPNAESVGPEQLLGFAWGVMHGDHAEYRIAGRSLSPESNLPVGYPPMWDLMLWAKDNGATWFDLGGVTVEGADDGPLRGISEFKRNFSETVERVGEEWVITPRPLRRRLARMVADGLRRPRQWLRAPRI